MSATLQHPAPAVDGHEAPAAAAAPRPKRGWRADLAPYTVPSTPRAVAGLLTSVVPYLALSTAMALLLDVSYWLTLLVAVPTAGFAVRTYIVFHDCAHGSFLPSKRANHVVGVVTALIVFTPFAAWRHHHAVHHATAGDLDRRGEGDVATLTVDEYRALPWHRRLLYRFGRSPAVMLTLGPVWELLIQTRIWKRTDRTRIKRSVIGTNVALAVIVAVLCWIMGPVQFLLVQVPITWLAGAAGIWLFYVQHQYEDAYWENSGTWDYAEAALQGSSFLKLPRVLQFFSGNIGLHHVHHLSAKVPNYRLQAAHDNTTILREVPVLTAWDGVKALRLKLWDPRQGRLVTWRQAAAVPR
ncbi:fatty acid desaturase [Patulibacter minatonensis]|uniref:fatty acid desaturase n=1 Tax=Patulibacter minatonensis TaxID=298163 RepID=UPI0004B3253D|nr:fatty acid desaturase [Patulibacter minatonensis]